ncbi:VOC family protein [Chitinibacteraceae bacterium HSL-7]
MPGPARAGVMIYARDARRLADFYCHVLDMALLHRDDTLSVIENADQQLVIYQHHIVAAPHEREQTVKPFFSVDSLHRAGERIADHGGSLFGPSYEGPGFRVRNASDPEGNVFHLREWPGAQ